MATLNERLRRNLVDLIELQVPLHIAADELLRLVESGQIESLTFDAGSYVKPENMRGSGDVVCVAASGAIIRVPNVVLTLFRGMLSCWQVTIARQGMEERFVLENRGQTHSIRLVSVGVATTPTPTMQPTEFVTAQ